MDTVKRCALVALVLTSCGGCAPETRNEPPKGPEPIPCDVAREGGCFDLVVDGQTVRQLDTPDGTAMWKGVNYLRHTRASHMWFVPGPVSATPTFTFAANARSAGWFKDDTCLDVIVEQANPETYHARRFPTPHAEPACNRDAANVRVEGGRVVTSKSPPAAAPLPPGEYVSFVRAYGKTGDWDMKTLFFTVGAP
jgi:hypothetical protein